MRYLLRARVLVTSFTEKVLGNLTSPPEGQVYCYYSQITQIQNLVEACRPETVYPWPWTRAHQWSRYQLVGPGAPTGPSSWATVTSMEVHEACTTQASPRTSQDAEKEGDTALSQYDVCSCGSTSFNTELPRLPFLYVCSFSCTCYFP